MILARAPLSLSIVNFALALPQQYKRLKVCVTTDIAGDVTTASYKRWDSLDKGSMNLLDHASAEPEPEPGDVKTTGELKDSGRDNNIGTHGPFILFRRLIFARGSCSSSRES
jgi:hypothetical protein